MSMESIESQKRKRLKIVEPYFEMKMKGLYLTEGSPYQSRIDDALTMLRETGFLHKWYSLQADSSKSLSKTYSRSVPGTKENMRLICNQLLAVGIVGYSLALLALTAEIATANIVKYRWFKRLKIIRTITNMNNRC